MEVCKEGLRPEVDIGRLNTKNIHNAARIQSNFRVFDLPGKQSCRIQNKIEEEISGTIGSVIKIRWGCLRFDTHPVFITDQLEIIH